MKSSEIAIVAGAGLLVYIIAKHGAAGSAAPASGIVPADGSTTGGVSGTQSAGLGGDPLSSDYGLVLELPGAARSAGAVSPSLPTAAAPAVPAADQAAAPASRKTIMPVILAAAPAPVAPAPVPVLAGATVGAMPAVRTTVPSAPSPSSLSFLGTPVGGVDAGPAPGPAAAPIMVTATSDWSVFQHDSPGGA